MRAWMMIAAVLVATPAMAADQFDLICRAKNTEVRYRIDLARGEWCAGDCLNVRPIVSVTSGTLLLESESSDKRERETQNQITRSTGAWVYYRADPLSTVSTLLEGQCNPTNFTGFPATKF